MKVNIFIYLGVILLFVQCTQRNNVNKNSNSLYNKTVNPDSLKALINFVLSPNEIINEILTDSKKFNTEIVNSKANSLKYISSNNQAINLGVYISDFAYLNLSGSRANSLDYFKIISGLAQKNNIYGCFDDAIFNRIEDNLANRDSLINISEEMYYNMTDVLENSKRPKLYALISSGALVESFYLAVMNISDFSENNKVIQKLFEQEKIVKNVNAFLSINIDDPYIRIVYNQIQSLIQIMEKAERKSIKLKVIRDKNSHLDIKGGEDIKVNEKLFDEFKNKVIIIRNEMVNISNE